MEIKGRLTENAVVRETKRGKLVTNFTISMNDDILPLTILCWIHNYRVKSVVAGSLYKGALVKLTGWMEIDTWVDRQGIEFAALMFKTSNIKILCIPGTNDVSKMQN